MDKLPTHVTLYLSLLISFLFKTSPPPYFNMFYPLVNLNISFYYIQRLQTYTGPKILKIAKLILFCIFVYDDKHTEQIFQF